MSVPSPYLMKEGRQVLKIYFAIIASLFITHISAAEVQEFELRAGVVSTSNLSNERLDEELARLTNDGWNSCIVVRLKSELDAPGRKALSAKGLTLLTCLGPKMWIARTGPELTKGFVPLHPHLAWAGELKSEWKLDPWLAAGNIPMWTVERDQIEAAEKGEEVDPLRLADQLSQMGDPEIITYVLAHPDVDLDDFKADLERETNGAILSEMRSINGVVLKIPNSKVTTTVRLKDVLWLEPALPHFKELNDDNRRITQVNEVQEAPFELDGEGVSVMVYDGGAADGSHPDFSGRLTAYDSSGQSSHATHVSGTVGGDGTNSGGVHRGMAPGVTIASYGFEQEGGLSEGFLYSDPGDLELDYSDAILNHGAVISNNSIGTNTAPNGFPCEWTGNYGVTSNLIDSVVRGGLGQPIRIVWANGNERQSSNCGTLYNTTAPPACAKNHITVGALNSNDESMTSFSSWGPSDDGRIKPDISGPGCQSDDDGGVTSTVPGGGYSSYCGTSMSSPTVTGISALVIQAWRQQYPGEGDLWNSSLKALLANTGADLGPVGPDCLNGFGSVRARNAIEAVYDDRVVEAEVNDSSSYEFLVIVDPDEPELKITLAWDDVPSSPLPTLALVNDLDLVVTSPTGARTYPLTIDPSNPEAAATAKSEDHLNNMEQVIVQNPTPGAWRVEIRGFAVPVGPQTFSVATTPKPTQCSSSGIVGLNRQRYPLEATMTVTVVDCDLNGDDTVVDTVQVMVSSDDEPNGEMIVLTEEDPAASVFTASIPMSTTDSAGVLMATDGSEVRALYIDAEDSDGNTNIELLALGVVDGTSPTASSVAVSEFHPDGATISVSSSEPVRITILYGSSCGSLNQEISRSAYLTDHEIRIQGLIDTFSYAYSIVIEDLAGNSSSFDNNGKCWEFTIPDALDFFAEQFSSGVDVDGYSTRFDQIKSADFFIPCTTEIVGLPVDPSGGNVLSLSDDSSVEIFPNSEILFYGNSYSSAFVNSNGSVTFESGHSDYNESLSLHFNRIGVSGLFDDLNPSDAGTISWKETSVGLVVTFENVQEYGAPSSLNTFQIIFGFDESVTISWLGINVSDAIVGLSPGTGTDPQFIPTDFSNAEQGCLPRPPIAMDISLSTSPGEFVEFDLMGNDDGQPNPPGMLEFVVLSLPQQQLKVIETGQVLSNEDLPYTMPMAAAPTLRYESFGNWEGTDSFSYLVDDGGDAPNGGESAPAEVDIIVSSGPELIVGFTMDEDPNWEYDGEWAFGQPLGSGGDPSSGATGNNVIGYNLSGQYANNIPEFSVTSGSIDCSNFTDVQVNFQRWLGIESSSYDQARFSVSVDGGDFVTIWSHTGGSLQDSSWQTIEYDISDVADGSSNIRLRWVMGNTDSSVTYCGWNIDDVEVIGVNSSPGVPGDLNGDGLVNGADVGILLSAWGDCDNCPADLSGDGKVDGKDFGLLLSYWTSIPFAPSYSSTTPETAPNQPELGGVSEDLLDLRLINRDVLGPRYSDGLIIAPYGYLQHAKARLELEVAGEIPLTEHDLLVVNGEAYVSGTLEIRVPEGISLPNGDYVVMCADLIHGAFDEVSIIPGDTKIIQVCINDHTVVVRIGESQPKRDIRPITPAVIIEMIERFGENDRLWDINGDSRIDALDLGILLSSSQICRN